MRSDFILSCCSTADLPLSYFEERDIHFTCFRFQMDGKEYLDDLGQSIPFDEFYRRIAVGAQPTTSQINVQQYVDYFEPFLKAGREVLHIAFSSGLSGSVNSARIAQETLAEKGTVEALTGPVERADAVTVKRHLEAVSEREAMIYKHISEVLVEIAQKKNPKRKNGDF